MMKKRTLLLSAAILIFLLVYFRPLSFPELSFEGGDTLSVNRVDLAIEAGKPHMTSAMYYFEEGSPEAEAIGEILARYSCRRSLRTRLRSSCLPIKWRELFSLEIPSFYKFWVIEQIAQITLCSTK